MDSVEVVIKEESIDNLVPEEELTVEEGGWRPGFYAKHLKIKV